MTVGSKRSFFESAFCSAVMLPLLLQMPWRMTNSTPLSVDFVTILPLFDNLTRTDVDQTAVTGEISSKPPVKALHDGGLTADDARNSEYKATVRLVRVSGWGERDNADTLIGYLHAAPCDDERPEREIDRRTTRASAEWRETNRGPR